MRNIPVFTVLEDRSLFEEPVEIAAVLDFFRRSDGSPDAVRCALLLAEGEDAGRDRLDEVFGHPAAGESVSSGRLAGAVVEEVASWNIELTGAEAVTVLLVLAGVSTVFAYAGTSELSLCDAVTGADGIELINGRGDKESAFMAAGASLLEANRGVALLHGARGLTNAMGAVADARRSEAGTLCVVGLPSSSSARFLPPHGEADLLAGLSGLVDWVWEAPAVPADHAQRLEAARHFIHKLRQALSASSLPPCRPALFGVPQDVLEKPWIPLGLICSGAAAAEAAESGQAALELALEEILTAEKPVFLIDDYALSYPGIREALDHISRRLGAPVLQVRYRRGPMLFERLRQDEVENFVGWLNPFATPHSDLLEACDLLVTVEDRNIYERVVGRLPACRKIAVNTDPQKVIKNEYLEEKDLLLVGEPAGLLNDLTTRLERRETARSPWFGPEARNPEGSDSEPGHLRARNDRRPVVESLAQVLAGWSRPVLVDDSQMFGGLIAEHYDLLPGNLRVFGGHGAFVGSGLSYATGLAIADRSARVMCTLGDQAFTNSFQGLVSAMEQKARVLYVVCNNGESVSLQKQGRTSLGTVERPYLSNVPGLRYQAIAQALNIPCMRVPVPVGGPADEVGDSVRQFSAALAYAAAVDGPSMVELVLPSAPEAWSGIWLTKGLESTDSGGPAPVPVLSR
ncbi:thiamine pyrophosphate-binding protein [Streptomyces sp. NPDC102441]|uniref:thiamine pyrophosphate-binding protein n=1 Tax=Streptomyces sp. NPDC102441 TaxID=3366176 RepID=UPI0038186998